MLAQVFKTAAELNITEKEVVALKKVLDGLESGGLFHCPDPEDRRTKVSNGFNMNVTYDKRPCGTVGCIGGWAAHYMSRNPDIYCSEAKGELRKLFYVDSIDPDVVSWEDITTEDSARALRNYLSTGKAGWMEILNVVEWE